ncbi:hypothetical protein LOD99_5622 [Oopsacas minuta]|uniref:Uncharacterized protein n=1 Tax=Oopsacas minuta TaxID=111878 RepID=A0AAV7JQ48_9METZ|nr:hypothetical protein LOD99_5622 [Oopsacas minuta]
MKYEEDCKNSCTAIRRDCPCEKCLFKGQLQQINAHLKYSAFLHASFYQEAIEDLKGQVNELEMKNREMGNQLKKLEILHKGLAQSSYGSNKKRQVFSEDLCHPSMEKIGRISKNSQHFPLMGS